MGHELGYEPKSLVMSSKNESCVQFSPDDRKKLRGVGYVPKGTAGHAVFWCRQMSFDHLTGYVDKY